MLKTSKRVLALVLMLAMTVSMFIPMTAFAATGSVSDFASFMEDLEVLEQYAKSYAASNSGKTVQELMINFIRTGVDRYNDGNWKTLAGEEIVGFTSYVEAQDAATGNTVMDLRDIIVEDFKLPNGNQVDFGHMFGTLNIAYVSPGSADLGGWAGDLCDLVYFSKMYGNVPGGTVDEMAKYVLEYCFGVDAKDAFGMDDFYGDLDAFYLSSKYKAGESVYETAKAYFTADLDDEARAAYFMNNRFKGMGLETREDVREAVYDVYANNVGIQVLEADRGIVSSDADLRRACCYAFADYLFDCAGHLLDTGSESEGGDTPDDPTDPDEPVMDNEYYSIFSSSSSTLAPGITQTINYAQTADKKQIVYYVATVDVNREDVTIMANYRDNDPSKGWGMQRVEDQAKALVAKHSNPADAENYIENFNAIVATNADGYNMSTGEPGGLLVMEGIEYHPVDKDGFFAILKNGSAMIGTQADYATYKDKIQEGIGGFGAVLIKDGEIVTSKLSSYQSTRASRTAIGITADGKVVMMVLDGRQEPFSAGGAMEEIAQIMKDAGCVNAINLDGGGSTTYLSKPEGEDDLKLINRPSDGYARSVSTSLVAVSTAKSSKEFDRANISSEYEYLTVNTTLQLTATGVSNTGNAAPLPEDATWTVSDANVGTVTADGVFTATANGDVEVQLVSAGQVIGSITLHVVIPDALVVNPENINAIFGVAIEIPLKATYEGNYVAFNDNDVILGAYEDTAGIFEGLYFTGDETVGIRKVNGVAMILANEAYTMFTINLYKADEAFFDFDNVTSGNKQFAWLREVSNSETKDDILYQIVDSNSDMVTDYTFAIDMTQIEIPDQLADLTSMLPGADTGATAWDFMLQLAERVSVLSEVKITAQFDKNFDVDVSEMQIANEYFELKSAVVDENNTLTMVCNWIDQTSAIDPATANSICILSGIKLTPKDDAAWGSNNRLNIVNTGDVSYRIYLRASSLYSFANKPENQEKYNLYPYSSSETGYEGGTESGAYFGKTYTTFRDEYILDGTNRNGWYNDDSLLYYYVNNELLPAGIYELPSYEDPTVKFWYQIDESGASL
ncbi:MAG: phosphodiester glycosidase family protein [Clostridia bacterium]|nr:phosphodiester glycosidase family protein [Clostridia bacterium]